MPKDAPHPDLAYAWLNYTMQGNIFWMMLRDFPLYQSQQSRARLRQGESERHL